jgi:sulfur-carrier protein adenylyltransferase/sulfurtransferase
MNMNPAPHRSRYEKQLRLQEIGEAGQARMARARVLVIGSGGLGCPVLQYLCGCGVGTLGVVDGDDVELSNLHRQVLYNEEQLGQPKALAAAQSLRKLNSEVRIIPYPAFLTPDLALDIVRDYDVIADCSDNFGTRYLINDVCMLYGKPFVSAALYKNQAQVSLFNSQELANPLSYRDVFPEDESQAQIADCNENGVLGPLAGLAGLYQAMEVIKHLVTPSKCLINKLLLINGWDLDHTVISLDYLRPSPFARSAEAIRQHNYAVPCRKNEVHEIEPGALEALLEASGVVIVDVRNYGEGEAFGLANPIQIPLAELSDRLNELVPYNSVVFICQSGKRSAAACRFLQRERPEKKVMSLRGGVSRVTL